jgi:hypothetical protein
LRRVHAIAAGHDQHLERVDPLSLRRRAFDALRDLLSRLASRQPLVMWIDDLQWADADSVVLLDELLRRPHPPVMLTVLCFRSEETAEKPFLQALLRRAGRDLWSAISLEPMTESEAHTLIEAVLPAHSSLTDEDKGRMTRDGGGSPFVLEQLARYSSAHRVDRYGPPTFAAMSRRGSMRLPDARGFLETLATGPADGARPRLRRMRNCSRAPVARRHAPRVPLDSQQRLVGEDRDVPRSDSRSTVGARGSRRGAPDSRPHRSRARAETQ